MSGISIKPAGKYATGRIIDIVQTKGGIELPDTAVAKVTVFLLVDRIGPEVTKIAVGDVILYMTLNHVFLRDGTHVGIVHEDSLIGQVEGLDTDRIHIEGDERRPSPRESLPLIITP
jgi:hypothetical protein